MITKVLKITKMLKIVKPKNIAERIKASKPSKSSTQITMEMVRSVESLLYYPYLLLSLVYLRGYAPAVLSKKLKRLQLFLTLTANRCIEHETSKSSRSADHLTWRYLRMFVDAVKEDLQDLLRHDACLKVAFDDKIPWLQQGLSYISGFLIHLASTSKCTVLAEVNSLQARIEDLAIEAAIVVYSSYNEEMDKTSEALQLKLNHVKPEIDLIQLLTSEATIIAHLKDLSDYVQEALIFLTTFPINSLGWCKEHAKRTELLALIQSLTRQSWSFVNSSSHLAREINGSNVEFFLKFKFIKAAITRMCTGISASSTLDHPTIDLLNFLPINFEVIDSYFNMIKYSKTSSSGRHNMDLVLMGFHEYILDNLLVKDETDLSFTVADEVKKFYDGLLLVAIYLVDHPVQCNGHKKRNESTKVTSSSSVAYGNVSCLTIYGTTGTETKRWKVNLVLQFFVESFKFVSLLKHKATVSPQVLDLTEIAHEGLIFLVAILTDLLRQHAELNQFHDLLMCAEVSVHRLSHISESFYGSFMDRGNNEKTWLSLFDYVQEIRSVKILYSIAICIKNSTISRNVFDTKNSSSFSFPKTNGLGFLDCFLGKLEDLLCSKNDSVLDLENYIGSIKEGLLCLRSLTNHFPEIYDEHDEFYGLMTSVTEMAYKAEYVTDSCLTCSHPRCAQSCKHLIELVPSLSANTPRANEEMEGFQEAMNKIKEQLLRGSSELDIISIVGMPGIGKTTLADKIFNDLILTPYFDVHAKCRATQVYSWKELLLTILNDVLEPADRAEKEDGELANELRQVLLTKRFLILIDDVWDKTAWDDLYMCFRDAQSGSRIILTTRLSDIANYVRCESNTHHLRLFRDDESWTLLQEEVFQGERCPPELVDVGFRIAKSCGGLPLFIVLVAGVLKEEKKEADVWKEVEDSLGSRRIGSLEEIQTDANSIPSFIAKLSNLETFVVRGLRGEMILPCSLLKMVKLRHIVVKHRASFSLHEYPSESLDNSQLNDLQTFSSPRLSYGIDAEAILTKMPNLRKLSCIFSSTFGHSEKVKGRCVVFPRLEFLSHLESLKLVSNSYPAKLPHEFNFPSKLRELTLSKFRLPWSEISSLENCLTWRFLGYFPESSKGINGK
ncbi:putative prolycopene isomerase 1, chloroplastic-like [Capsicum annuum]|nr:putative prolycopene isomerase 1, chloroplastic-like [Capsicum annuum]